MGSPFSNSTPVLENWCVFHMENNKNNFCLQEKKLLKGCTRGERMEGEGAADGGGGVSGWRGRGQRMLSIEDKK